MTTDLSIKLIKAPPEKIRDPPPPIEPVEFLPQHPFRMYICAPSGSGKTNLLMNMLFVFYKKYFHKIFIFSANYFDDDAYRVLDGILDESQIITDANEIADKLTEIFDEQSEKENRNRRVLIILDDFMLQSRNNKPLQTIMTKGRAKNISMIIINQNYKGSDPIIRTNVTHAIFFDTNHDEVQKIHSEHGSNLTYNDFLTIFRLGTTPYEDAFKPFLLIDYKTSIPTYKYRRTFDIPLLPLN